MLKKILKGFTLTACLILLFGLMAACSGSNSNKEQSDQTNREGESTEEVTITFFNTSAEVNGVFEALFNTYHELNPNVTVELIPTPVGGQQLEKFQSLLASGNPATVANLDPGTILQYKDNFLNLETEKSKYEELTKPGSVESAMLDGEFLGIPWTAQGYGLLYNKRAVEEAIGRTFDPDSIRTRDDLKALFEEIENAGTTPVLLHGADWSLGAHYLGLIYSLQSQDVAENREFVQELINGNVDLMNNPQFNGLMDTFDLLKQYNIHKDDPLVANLNQDSSIFANGKAAFYFMGDWAWSIIGPLEGRDEEFGVIPVPISNNPDDFGNSQVAYSQPKLFAIDDSGSTPEQQEAAKDLIEWMVTSEEGQHAIVAEMGLSMPYKNVKAESSNVLANAIAEYVNQGQTIDISVINYLPQDYWSQTGASMQKYLSDVIERERLAEEVEGYWQSKAGR